MAQILYASSQTGGATASSAACTKPTSLAVGDLMIAHVFVNNVSGSISITPPSGWTQIQFLDSNFRGTAQFYRVANSADVAASNFTFAGSASVTSIYIGISRFTNTGGTFLVDQAQMDSALSGYPTLTGITPTASNSMFIIFGAHQDNAGRTVTSQTFANSPPTFTEAYDVHAVSDSGPSTMNINMAYGSRAQLGSTGNVSLSVSGAISIGTLSIINIAPPLLTPLTFSLAASQPEGTRTILANPLTLATALTTPTVSEIPNSGWQYTPKPAADDWEFTPKS